MRWMAVLTLLAALIPFSACQNCVFPDVLLGNWTSSNYGVMTFTNTTPTVTISKSFDGSGSPTTILNCILTQGTQYILQSTNTIPVFSGTESVYLYMCLDLRQVNDYSYYFYLNSIVEPGFGNERLVGLFTTMEISDYTDVCTTSLDIAEFHTMVKTGQPYGHICSENRYKSTVKCYTTHSFACGSSTKRHRTFETRFEREAVEPCPTALLGTFWYHYYDRGQGPLCDNSTSMVDVCNNQNTTYLQFNSTGCSDVNNPGFSADGQLGCLNAIEDNTTISNISTYYTSLYNFDTDVDSTSTYRFICLTVTTYTDPLANDTVFVSLSPTECIAGQLATTLPSAQSARLEMYAWYTCVPTSSADDTSWLWLILLCVFLALALIIVIIVIVVCCLCCCHKSSKKSTEREALETEEHPLGEVSLPLDVPRSMEPLPDLSREYTITEEREDLFKNTYMNKGKDGRNPIFESSMTLDMKGRKMNHIQNGDAPYIDPFTEMDSRVIVTVSPSDNKAAKSLRNAKRIPFARSRTATTNPRPWMNGDVKTNLHKPVFVSDGRNYTDLDQSRSIHSECSEQVPSFQSSRKTNKVKSLNRARISAIPIKSPRPKSKVKKVPRVPGSKLVRSKSAISIRSGSPRSASRKEKRSKTLIVTASEKEQSGLNEFVMAEMDTSATSATGAWVGITATNKPRRPKQAIKTILPSKAVTRMQRSKTTADDKLYPKKKSILKRKSAYSSLERLTDEELYYQSNRQLTSHMVSAKPAITNTPFIYVSPPLNQNPDNVVYQPTGTAPPWR